MYVLNKKSQVRYAIQKEDKKLFKAINDRVGIYNVSLHSLSLSPPLFLQKRQNQMLPPLPAAAAAAAS